MLDFWPECGHRHLRPDQRGWLEPTGAWWAHWLDRPELALVAESCDAEIALHRALRTSPVMPVSAVDLAGIRDDDARENYRLFLALRDGLLAAGTLEAFYCGLFTKGAITLPPLFIDLVAQAILRHLLDEGADAFEARAAELLFRPQRISLEGGRVLAGDRATLDRLSDAGGFGAIGRWLAEAKVPLRAAQLQVLTTDNAVDYWHDGGRHRFLLDLTQHVAKELAPGVSVPLALARSGMAALARVLERWVTHLLGVAVAITPLPRIADERWRWHLGLDVQASAILDDLYLGVDVEADRLQQLLGLFRLDFERPSEMHADVAGAVVYLGLAMDREQGLRLKPQNLLLNLPLARRC